MFSGLCVEDDEEGADIGIRGGLSRDPERTVFSDASLGTISGQHRGHVR